ncbi:hypothetical protein V1498_06505 [Peribacillus sp. SCS-26]|uniref:hypothetical protein n=1 Tax=Paraperibacillus marinus TaxID=3115295 RepID=UPI0039069659
MKRIIYLLVLCFILFIIYYDLTSGTLQKQASATPAEQAEPPEKAERTEPRMDYVEVQIEPGDTILSLIEEQEGKITEPIENIIKDFQALNQGLSPEDIQIGRTYKIPSY